MLFSNVFISDFEQGLICPLVKSLYQLRLGIENLVLATISTRLQFIGILCLTKNIEHE